MTAEGILYVDETCRDKFKKQLDKEFGKDKWKLDGSPYGYIWNTAQMPPELAVDVLDDETDKVIGHIIIENKYEKEYDGMQDCMYLQPYPYKIKSIWKGVDKNESGQKKVKR